jgi:hypothetical protein
VQFVNLSGVFFTGATEKRDLYCDNLLVVDARCKFGFDSFQASSEIPIAHGRLARALSTSVTRASRSSISIAFAEWFNTLSAALTFVDGGVAGSTIAFSSVETAALEACCNRAMD